MRRMLSIVAVLIAVAPLSADNGVEMKKFAGTWKVKDGSSDGIPIPEEARKLARLSFDGNRFAFKGGPTQPVTTFKVNAAAQTIEIAPPKGETKTLRGRYKFERGILTLCLTDGDRMPATLASGKDRMILVLERDR